MPLDPIIANPTMAKLADPSEAYGNALKNAYLFNQIQEAKQKREEADGAKDAYAGNVDPVTGKVNRVGVTNYYANNKLGNLIAPQQKTWAESDKAEAEIGLSKANADKATAEGTKFTMEATGKVLDAYKQGLSGVDWTNPGVGQDQLFARAKEVLNHPLVAKFNADMGVTPEQGLQQLIGEMHQAAQSPQAWRQYGIGLQSTIDTALKATQPHILDQDLGGHKRVLAVDPNNPGAPKVLSDTPVTESPNRPVQKTEVNMGGNKFIEGLAAGAVKEYQGMRPTATTASQNFAKLDRIQALVNDKNYIGALANPTLNLARLAKAAGFDVDDKAVVNTQVLNKMLAANVLDQIQPLHEAGLSRFTNTDLEMLKKASATGDLEPGAINVIIQKQKEDLRNAVINHNTRFNELMTHPETAKALQMFGYHPIDIPGIPPAAIQKLRTNPNKVPLEKLTHDFDTQLQLPPGTAQQLLGSPTQPGGGGSPTGQAPFSGGGKGAVYQTSLGPITYDPNGGVNQWMPLVNKHAPSYGVDPELARIIMNKESGGNPRDHNGANKNGSWDHGLMQVNSVHGFTTQQLDDPEFNIRQGLSILAGSLKAHPGDLHAGIKGYNGSGHDADVYADKVLEQYHGPGLVRK